MLGPYGISYMYVSPRWQHSGSPLEFSWLIKEGSEDFSNLSNYAKEYRTGARKFDMGEFPQINLLPMAIAGLQQINEWGTGFIQAEIKKLTDIVTDHKRKNAVFNELASTVGHLTSISLGSMDAALLKTRLADAGIVISVRAGSVRISPHVYNEPSEIQALLSCLTCK